MFCCHLPGWPCIGPNALNAPIFAMEGGEHAKPRDDINRITRLQIWDNPKPAL